MDNVHKLHELAYELETSTNEILTLDAFKERLATAASSNRGEFVTNSGRTIQEFKISYAYENHLSKERCTLCKMYFSRETVKYKVPTHRIVELKKSWKSTKADAFDGRRYHSPSYLYTTTSVCLFCSQFFSTMPEERVPSPPAGEFHVLPHKEAGPKLEITTTINRSNIAVGKRAYQSSDVDFKEAILACTPPYDAMSRTAREVDPWWEIDLGRKYNMHSISFDILVGIRQQLDVYIFLLEEPKGFNDPFLANMMKICPNPSHSFHQPFHKLSDKARMEHIEWKLPKDSIAFAIRIQLKGISILSLQNFLILQGDDVTLPTDEEMIISYNSLASLKPTIILDTLKEKYSFLQKEMIINGEIIDYLHDEDSLIRNRAFDHIDAVVKLKDNIRTRYNTLEDWKQRTLAAAAIFPEEEIPAMYKIIFKYASDSYLYNRETSINEHELLKTGLIQYYPRCDLQELHQRIRSILHWIQSRTHLKALGPLLNSSHLTTIANNPHEPLYRLMTIIKRIEYYWNKKEKKEKQLAEEEAKASQSPMKSGRLGSAGGGGGGSSSNGNNNNRVVPKTQESRGCSWSQFLILMNLFVTQQYDAIPYLAFNIDHPRISSPIKGDELGSQYSYQSGDHMTVSSYSLSVAGHQYHRPKHHQLGYQSSLSNSNSLGGLRSSSVSALNSLDGFNQRSWSTADGGGGLYSPSTSQYLREPSQTSLSQPSIQETVRKMGLVTKTFDSSFSEYKFAHFKKRQKKYTEFPSELSLEFAKTLNPRRQATNMSTKTSSRDDDDDDDDPTGKSGNGANDDNTVASNLSDFVNVSEGKSILRASSGSLPALFRQNSAGAPGGKPKLERQGTAKALTRTPTLQRMSTAALKDLLALSGIEDESSSSGPGGPAGMFTPPLKRTGTAASVSSVPATPMSTGLHSPSRKSPTKSSDRLSHTAPTPLKSAMSKKPENQRKSITAAGGPRPSLLQKTNTAVTFNSADDETDDYNFDTDDDDGNTNDKHGKQIKHIDFFRVCALCELRLPRNSVEIKVLRKHIVKLRSTWDNKLVSKEVRSLDNTISMYNLVYVCLFCAQYFDPDFPDGIAYPTRIPAPKTREDPNHKTPKKSRPSTSNSYDAYGSDSGGGNDEKQPLKIPEEDLTDLKVSSLADREDKLIPFYDVRHLPNAIQVGEVLKRPETMESRQRARRALDVVAFTEKRPDTALKEDDQTK